MPTVPVDEVWGIGSASAGKLGRLGVRSAADLAGLDAGLARKMMTVVGGRIVYELRGVSCLPLEELEPTRKGIAVTRSFGAPVLAWERMSEAMVSYAARAGEKLRRHGVAASNLSVFMHTSPFNGDPWYSNGASGHFVEATNDTSELTAMAVRLARRAWRDGFRYVKAGVILDDVMPHTVRQAPLWAELDRERREKLWRVVDQLNVNLGRGTIRLLGAGKKDAPWQLRSDFRSPRWTTRWSELPAVKAR